MHDENMPIKTKAIIVRIITMISLFAQFFNTLKIENKLFLDEHRV